MYSFGLEECGEYDKAEKAGMDAIARNPDDAWASKEPLYCRAFFPCDATTPAPLHHYFGSYLDPLTVSQFMR